jgi:hypothetical protein
MSSRIPMHWAAVVVAALFITGCTEKSITDVEEETDYSLPPYEYVVPDLSDDIVIGYAQTVYVESENMTIRFSDVLYDARCPEGVLCFWAGEVKMEFAFGEPDGEEETTFALLQPGRNPCSDPELYSCCFGYRLYVLMVDPYPVHNKEVDPEEYLALIRVVLDEECIEGIAGI